ncbi:hypothetical protein PFLUV_G00064640 [Perca fluviatilis]|uniref:C-type lectin domain-containing protein n=1 Tax=Perca fluviatilis TaxID=8168 RepID=A0A6A5ENW6_PERFL|nr:hypothetical protein PFLUV_G00064640 [Perca fluviatilis]
MSWAAGGGLCQTQVSTNPGRRSSDDGRLDDQTLETVEKSAQGWVLMDSGSNVTFVIVINILTWTAAQSYCRAHYTDLASVRNMTENQKVQAMLSGGGLFWIGLFRDTWKWSDGSTSSFSFWKNGQPDNKNKTCVSADFSQSGAWEGWSCDMERAFICYGPGEC